MSARKPVIDPKGQPTDKKLRRGEPRTETTLTPSAQRVLNLIRRASHNSPVMASALSDKEREHARRLFKSGLVSRAQFDEGVGFFALDDDTGHEPDPVTDFAGAVAYAGDLAAMEADAKRTEL